MKKIIQNIALLIVTIVIILVFFEIILRIFLPKQAEDVWDIYNPNALNGWVPKPNIDIWKMGENYYPVEYIHNDKAFRDEKPADFKKENKKRIVIVGDSFVYGFGLDQKETLSYNLQNYLGEDYEVFNMGVAGYSSLQAFALASASLNFQPDIIIYGEYHNDILDNIDSDLRPAFNLKRGRLSIENYTYDPSDFVMNMTSEARQNENSSNFLTGLKIYSFVKNKIAALSKENCSRIGSSLYLYTKKYDEKVELMMHLNCWSLNQFLDLSKKSNITFYVLYIPSKIEVYDKVYRDNTAKCQSPTETDIDKVQNNISQCTSKYNISLINLVPLFRENNDRELYNKAGGHWSPIATNLTARYVVEKLRMDGVIS